MSQKDTETIGGLEASESLNGNLSKLAELAREAYERKATKECLDLTRAMLLIDPTNTDALQMRSAIQTGIHRDLESARTFLRQAHSKEIVEKQSEPDQTPAPAELQFNSGDTLEPSDLATTFPPPTAGNPKKLSGTTWMMLVSVLVFLIVSAVSLPWSRTRAPAEASPPVINAADKSTPAATANAAQPDASIQKRPSEVELVSAPAPGLAIASGRVSPPVTIPRPDTILPTPPVMAASGTLAINSPTSVDIFKDDVYLGSVPVSLQLSAGTHTLEYHHGNLQKTVTHVINSNETTKAIITFDINVPINSKPWAEVFIDGAERKDLGETPLSGARVPIGSVLSFENPKFPVKKYRVTGNETAIQVVLP